MLINTIKQDNKESVSTKLLELYKSLGRKRQEIAKALNHDRERQKLFGQARWLDPRKNKLFQDSFEVILPDGGYWSYLYHDIADELAKKIKDEKLFELRDYGTDAWYHMLPIKLVLYVLLFG